MLWHLFLILSIVSFFYAALPAIGAFIARAQWRRFRQTVTTVSHYPTATLSSASRERAGESGWYRFFGTLEAIQGNDRIWLTNGRFSVAADLRGVRVYLIPEGDGKESSSLPSPSNAELGSVPWSRIFSLPEGTPVFVGGAFFNEDGRGVFKSDGRTRLLVAIYDCPRESVVPFAISGGRQRNELINPFTLPSAAIGSLGLLLLAFTLLAVPERLGALIAMTAAIAPLSPFLPPGFPLYFAYRSFWKKARLMRVQRDMVRLPLRYFPEADGEPRAQRATLLPDMEPYLMVRGTRDLDDPGTLLCGNERITIPADMPEREIEMPAFFRRASRPMSQREYVAFAGYEADEKGIRLMKPEDPFAQMVIVAGDPRRIARTSEQAARLYELIAAVLISIDVVVNVPLVFLLLSQIIR
jgi:hypothetical protein